MPPDILNSPFWTKAAVVFVETIIVSDPRAYLSCARTSNGVSFVNANPSNWNFSPGDRRVFETRLVAPKPVGEVTLRSAALTISNGADKPELSPASSIFGAPQL